MTRNNLIMKVKEALAQKRRLMLIEKKVALCNRIAKNKWELRETDKEIRRAFA